MPKNYWLPKEEREARPEGVIRAEIDEAVAEATADQLTDEVNLTRRRMDALSRRLRSRAPKGVCIAVSRHPEYRRLIEKKDRLVALRNALKS